MAMATGMAMAMAMANCCSSSVTGSSSPRATCDVPCALAPRPSAGRPGLRAKAAGGMGDKRQRKKREGELEMEIGGLRRRRSRSK
jgi:hypothetical protein